MGAIPTQGGVAFRVWAPNADRVFVMGTFNRWSKTEHPLEHEGDGIWATFVPCAGPGDEYKYRVVSGSEEFLRIDPYARSVTTSVGNAVVADPEFRWSVTNFEPPPLNEMVIYEMHVGTFSKEPDQPVGSLHSAIRKLSHLEDLGVNAIELMPVMEFAGAHSWGYNPALLFAIETGYGGPKAFKEFVDAAHARGMAVLLDVVYNHLGPSDLDLWQFDGWSESDRGGIYFYNDWRSVTPWGDTRPDYGREEVRRYIHDNVLMWLTEYGVDGLRWDATAYIRNADGANDDPARDIPDGWSLMQWINEDIRRMLPPKLSIAEDLKANHSLTVETDAGGAGFHAQWDAGFVHPVRQAIVTHEDSCRDLNAVRAAILARYNNDAFRRVIYTESHDEVANGKARVPEEIAPGDAGSLPARKLSTLGAGLVFTSPGVPMIFQGQELLEDEWFHDQDQIDWAKREKYGGILRLYRDLVRLRLNRAGSTRGLCGQYVDVHRVDDKAKLIAFHRWDVSGPRDSVIVVANLANQVRTDFRIGFPREGVWRVRLNSDSRDYDPEFGGQVSDDVTAEIRGLDGMPCSGPISIGPYTVVVLSQDD